MRITGRGLIILAAGLIGLLVIAAVAASIFLDINSFKPGIETAASKALGLEVRIDGKMGLSFFPFGISARDVRVSGRTGSILSTEELKIGLEVMPLLKREIRVRGCRLVRPSILIEIDRAGRYNFQTAAGAPGQKGAGGAFLMNELSLAGGSLVYLDRRSNEKVELRDIDLTLSGFSIADTSGDITKELSFTGRLSCRQALRKTLAAENLQASVSAEKGVFRIPIKTDIFGGKGAGDILIDMSGPVSSYKVELRVSGLDFDSLQRSLGSKKALGGKGALTVSVAMKSAPSALGSMHGAFSLRGDNLVIHGIDIDKVLTKYEATRKFDLVDLGAFFLAGPLGAAASEGYRLGDALTRTGGGDGRVRRLVSDWTISRGVADATDCALATENHRVALKGRLDLVHERYDDVVVALLDSNGCAKFSQKISGPFSSPSISGVSALETLLGPIMNLLGRAKGLAGGKCEVFYSGSVQPR